jgi:uncharacterized protein YecE (DUF72 family)
MRVGTAGWAIPTAVAGCFPKTGTALSRYAQRFNAVEINSTFYRSHRRSTFETWAASVPADFKFAIKLRKTITHGLKLLGAERELAAFSEETSPLGPRLGPLLVQLPPSLNFDAQVALNFFAHARSIFTQPIACEPRHASWFTEEADHLLRECRVARVAADPARLPEAAKTGGWEGLRYFRLHGSPVIYRSSYSEEYLSQLAKTLIGAAAATWCIFDNTASGAGCQNALQLMATLGSMQV